MPDTVASPAWASGRGRERERVGIKSLSVIARACGA